MSIHRLGLGQKNLGHVEDAGPTTTKKTTANSGDAYALGGTKLTLPTGHDAVVFPLAKSSDPLTAALDAHQPEIVALYGKLPLDTLVDRVRGRSYPREALADLLVGQNAARGAKQPVLDNIEKLRSPDTVAVVTGQQVGLFGGPLYSLFKALGAVNEAKALTARGIDAVPVFWLASYDHDLAEVNHAGVLGQNQDPVQVKLKNPGRKDLVPVGDEPLGPDIAKVLDAFEAALPDSPHKAETMAMLREIHTPEETYAGAFAKLVGRLTDDLGLVILDPNRREFNALAKPVLEKELFGSPSGPVVEAASAKIEALGFTPQIDARSERLNVFFIDDEGRRVALSRVPGGFETQGTPSFLDEKTARALLDSAPERFSPSALLRPVVEDQVLPTVGYVGGPSERKYYAQVGDLYTWAGLPAPHALKRPQFTIVDAGSASAVTEATGTSLVKLLDDPDLSKTLGLAGVPEAVRKAYAAFEEPREALQEISSTLDERLRQGAQRIVVRDLSDVKKALGLAFTRARAAVREAGLERLDKGLEANEKKVAELFGRLIEDVEKSDPSAGRFPSSSPIGGVMKTLNGLDSQLLKVGRQERPDLVSIMSRVKPRGSAPQEREMSIAQLVAELGPSVASLLVDRATVHQGAPELVVVKGAS